MSLSCLLSRGEETVHPISRTRYNSQRVLGYFRQHRVASIAAGHIVVAFLLGIILLSNAFGSTLFGAFAQSACSNNDHTYMVVSGDTLGAIANRYHTTWQSLATYNRIANANIIYINEHICIPGNHTTANGGGNGGTGSGAANEIRGQYNPYSYPQCTHWAYQRFYQLHGYYVPWTTNANAWEWTARAYQYGWRVSSYPSVGAIVDLQPWVQGAYNLGHVGVVEQVMANGTARVSNTNWGLYPYSVATSYISPGYGVTFIS